MALFAMISDSLALLMPRINLLRGGVVIECVLQRGLASIGALCTATELPRSGSELRGRSPVAREARGSDPSGSGVLWLMHMVQ